MRIEATKSLTGLTGEAWPACDGCFKTDNPTFKIFKYEACKAALILCHQCSGFIYRATN